MAKQPCSKEARAHIVMGGFLSRAVGMRLSEHEPAIFAQGAFWVGATLCEP